jgi:glycosyltransferase involved in cell wall biosynthesis
MQHSPLVSVLIPTYNYGRFLDEAIQSVLAQTYSNFELIIVDNNSTDNTTQVVKNYLTDKRVAYYRNDRNLGLVANWNKCVSYAKGEFVKFLMADDKFKPELLNEFVDIMRRYPDVALVTSNSEIFGARSKPRISNFIGLQNGKQMIVRCLTKGSGNLIGEPTTVMVRKRDLDRVGAFKSDFTCLVDLNMWLRLLDCGDAYFIAKSLSYFRVHNDQYSAKTNVNNWIDEYNFYKDVKEHNTYNLESGALGGLGLDMVIKDRAIHCAKGMYRILPRFFRGDNSHAISKAFGITARERVIGRSFFGMIKKHMHLYPIYL